MGRKADTSQFIPPEVAMFGNRFVRQWQAGATTYRTYASWWQLFYTAAVTRFSWDNLPSCIDERYLETCLFMRGTVAMCYRTTDPDQPIPFIVAPYATEGKLDYQNNPNKIRLLTANGQQFTRHAQMWVRRSGNQHGTSRTLMPANAAICWDSITRLPLFNAIDMACRRLAEFDVTIDQHVRSQRVPFIFVVPEEGKANAEEMYNRVDQGDPAIYITPTATAVVQVNALNTGVDYIADKLLNDELKIVSQTYTLLGIDNNAAAEKKERVQTAETVANNEQFLIQRQSCLKARRAFADRVMETFGLDIRPRWSVPHVWEDGQDMSYNPALETSAAAAKYGVSRGLFFGESAGGDPNDGNAL